MVQAEHFQPSRFEHAQSSAVIQEVAAALTNPDSRLNPGRASSEPRFVEFTPLPGAAAQPDYTQPFDLHVDPAKMPNPTDLRKNNPGLADQIYDISGTALYYLRHKVQVGDKDVPTYQYVSDAFRQMIGKYGEERVGQLMKTLGSQSEKGKLGGTYSLDEEGPDALPKLNERLSSLERLLQPGGVEKLQKFIDAMRQEGDPVHIDLNQMDGKYIDFMLAHPEERKARAELDNNQNMDKMSFFAEHREFLIPNTTDRKPSDILEAYSRWEKEQK